MRKIAKKYRKTGDSIRRTAIKSILSMPRKNPLATPFKALAKTINATRDIKGERYGFPKIFPAMRGAKEAIMAKKNKPENEAPKKAILA